jgi:hypothetical protein
MMRPNSPARSVTKPGQKQDEKKLEPQEQARKKKQEKLKWNTSKKIHPTFTPTNSPDYQNGAHTRQAKRSSSSLARSSTRRFRHRNAIV